MDIKLGFIILEYSDFQLNIIIIKYEVKSHPAHKTYKKNGFKSLKPFFFVMLSFPASQNGQSALSAAGL